MTETTPTWQERIGGRWAISLPAYLIGVVLNVPLLALTGGEIGAEPVPLGEVGPWLVIGILAAVLTGAWAYAMHRTLFRNRSIRPVPVPLVVGFHLVVGLIFGVCVVYGGSAWIAPDSRDPVARIVVIMLIGLWFGITMSLLLEARSRFQRQREALVERAVQLELATLSESEAARKVREAVVRHVDEALGDLRREVDGVLADTATPSLVRVDDWWRISASLRTTADATVRPLSHQLWAATEAAYPTPTVGRVLSRMFLAQTFAPIPSLIIMGIGYLGAGIYRFGPLVGVLAAAALAVGVALILAIANAVMGRLPRLHATVFIGAVIVSFAFSIAFVLALADGASTAPELAGALLGTAISVLAPAATASLNATRADVLARFADDTDELRIRQIAQSRQLANVTRAAARELHGSLQTRLIACAGAIDQASQARDVEQFRRALDMSVAILDAPVFEDAAGEPTSIALEIERRCAPWQGLCTFTVSIDPAAASLGDDVPDRVGRVVEEAIANACRHGLATEIAIAVDRTDDAVEVAVTDNGIGPTGGGAGLGTAMLMTVSGGRVDLDRAPSGKGARLLVSLPAVL